MRYTATHNGRTYTRRCANYVLRVVLFVDDVPVKWGTQRDSRMSALYWAAKREGKSVQYVDAVPAEDVGAS